MYYYAIVIKHMHPVEGKAPIPVAELITSDHTVLSLCYFMETFRRAEGLIFGFSSITYQRSDALLHVSKILNKGIKGTSNLCWLNSVLQAILTTPLVPLLKSAVLWFFNHNAFTFHLFTAATCAKRHTSIQKCFIIFISIFIGDNKFKFVHFTVWLHSFVKECK